MASRILVLGATGMLGHALISELDGLESLEVYGSARSLGLLSEHLTPIQLRRVIPGLDALDSNSIRSLLRDLRPEIVVNCVGVIKQDPDINDSEYAIRVNSLFPHVLARECSQRQARLIHVSTDCVFSGSRGAYVEGDLPDPSDFYGRSKLLGEVAAAPSLTLRTSVIGHELGTRRSLVDWFLSQSGPVNGFTHAIYSGFTTTEFARILATVVFPRKDLVGLFHIASTPISKYDLLRLIASAYEWSGELIPYAAVAYDRSLSADAFFSLTGYRPPPWPEMIADMRSKAKPLHLHNLRHA